MARRVRYFEHVGTAVLRYDDNSMRLGQYVHLSDGSRRVAWHSGTAIGMTLDYPTPHERHRDDAKTPTIL